MLQNYVPIFIYRIYRRPDSSDVAAAKLVRPDNPSNTPYECGIGRSTARGRYTVRHRASCSWSSTWKPSSFSLGGQFKALGAFGLPEMLIFLLILVVGYI
jgi:NADH:ubiquinone oxidoreductase subunit 3 (subunit A)